MKKNLDTKKKLDIARLVKLREQQRATGTAAATVQAPQVPPIQPQRPQMATAAATVDLTGSPSPQPHLPQPATGAAGTGRSDLPAGGGIGLVFVPVIDAIV